MLESSVQDNERHVAYPFPGLDLILELQYQPEDAVLKMGCRNRTIVGMGSLLGTMVLGQLPFRALTRGQWSPVLPPVWHSFDPNFADWAYVDPGFWLAGDH
jgi:hypothetical protein